MLHDRLKVVREVGHIETLCHNTLGLAKDTAQERRAGKPVGCEGSAFTSKQEQVG